MLHPRRKQIDDPAKHTYPAIPDGAEDEESTRRNLELLKGESLKPKPHSDVMKDLLTRTFPTRRVTIFNSNSSVVDTVNENPYVKKCAYVSLFRHVSVCVCSVMVQGNYWLLQNHPKEINCNPTGDQGC